MDCIYGPQDHRICWRLLCIDWMASDGIRWHHRSFKKWFGLSTRTHDRNSSGSRILGTDSQIFPDGFLPGRRETNLSMDSDPELSMFVFPTSLVVVAAAAATGVGVVTAQLTARSDGDCQAFLTFLEPLPKTNGTQLINGSPPENYQ